MVGVAALAQTPGQLVAENKARYPGQKVAYLEVREDVTVEIRHDSVQVLVRHHSDLLHLEEQSAAYARDEVLSAHFSRLLKLEARTLAPAADKYRALKVSDFRETFALADGVFFDDTRKHSFAYAGVVPGARTVLDYTVRHPDGRFLLPFYLGSYVPVLRAELVITAPKSVRIGYKLFNAEQTPVAFSRQERGDQVVYRWTAENLPGPPRDDDAPAPGYYLPHLVYFVEQATVAGQPRTLLGGVPELYAMYADFVRRIEPQPAATGLALQHRVDSLVAGAGNDEEKARRIYYWVQDNVRYIAFEQGLRGFIPHDAGLVYARRYGDCKDMANLTTEMLHRAGIPNAYLTWVGTRDLPYKYAELATPGVDNHMIATYEPRPGEYVFLDATSQHTPFGMPSAMIQGKEGLLALDAARSRVVPIPAQPAARSLADDASVLTLDGTGLRGQGRLQLSGYAKIKQSYGLDGLARAEESRYVQRLLERGNNKFFVDTYTVENLAARDKPLAINYQYRLQDYVQRVDDELYVNLSLERPYATDRIDTLRRRLPRTNEYAHLDRTRTELLIPPGYAVSYLPPEARSEGGPLGFRVYYERLPDRIVQHRELTVSYLLLEPRQFGPWNKAVGELGKAYREVVILKKK